MNINNIIYETTRTLFNIEDKLRIATIVLFAKKMSDLKFAELLYTDNHEMFIDSLHCEYAKYKGDFDVNLKDKNVRVCFLKTIDKVKEVEDRNGYYKALYDRDEYALVIDGLIKEIY